jgi:cytochrome c biogenesis protein
MGLIGWLRWAWRQLTSMRTALILLFLVALGSVPGSLLPQRSFAPERVAEYLDKHKTLGPWYDRFSLFDVFAAPWFAAIYILLFVSLAGCVIPRCWQLYKTLRARPPSAPKNLAKLPQYESYETTASPEEVLDGAHTLLKKRRFRADRTDVVSSEKGYLHETGNLVFHLSLLALLFAVGIGSMYGYKGNILVTEGGGFSNVRNLYDEFKPGKAFTNDELQPFHVQIDDFKATYITSGPQAGQASDFMAKVSYESKPGAATKSYDLRVNHPLSVDGAKLYLLGHGYSPTFQVKDSKGNIAFNGPAPFLPIDESTLFSEGVIKAADAQPEGLGFMAVFWPTAAASQDGKTVVSAFPGPANPRISIIGVFKGDVGGKDGVSRSAYQLDVAKLTRLKTEQKTMAPGETLKLPDGQGEITFTGYKEWVSLTVNHDPGRIPALVAGILAVLGLVVSFMTRRRRVWVRASRRDDGTTVVEIGGLTLGSPTPEFDEIVAALRPESNESMSEPVLASTPLAQSEE